MVVPLIGFQAVCRHRTRANCLWGHQQRRTWHCHSDDILGAELACVESEFLCRMRDGVCRLMEEIQCRWSKRGPVGHSQSVIQVLRLSWVGALRVVLVRGEADHCNIRRL